MTSAASPSTNQSNLQDHKSSTPSKPEKLKVALVCDWLTSVGGAERVLLEFHKLYPKAPIYTSQYSEKGIDWFKDADIRTGWLQIFPICLRRFIAPLRQRYFSHLDLTDYDLVISVTGAEAKSVRTKPTTTKPPSSKTEHSAKNRTPFSTTRGKTIHLCFCHVPTQYYWELYDDYLKHPGFGILDPLARLALKIFIKPLKKADYRSAQLPDYYITISHYAAAQIKKYYHRESHLIYPPVDVKKFSPEKVKSAGKQILKSPPEKVKSAGKQASKSSAIQEKSPAIQQKSASKSSLSGFFVTTSRQVTWKRLDLCIAACVKTQNNLILIGSGPEHHHLVKLARALQPSAPERKTSLSHTIGCITFLPQATQSRLKPYLENAKGYLFPSKEPFGIAPVEALAAGCPVIAFKEGGAPDYIQPGKNGLLFPCQTVDSLVSALHQFQLLEFNRIAISESARPFATEIFIKQVKEYLRDILADH